MGVFAGKWACVSSGMPAFIGSPVSFLASDGSLIDFIMDTNSGKVAFHAKHQKGQLTGTWRLAGFGEGVWHCKRSAGN